MAIGILVIVAMISCLAMFYLGRADRMLAGAVVFITVLWLLRPDEIPDGGEGIKLVLANLVMLIITLLLIRFIGTILFG